MSGRRAGADLFSRGGEAREVRVSLPHREFELVARVFARALTTEGGPDPVCDAARALGTEMADEVRESAGRHTGSKNLTRIVEEVLGEHGFEPFHNEGGNVRLRNCPFHLLSQEYTQLVCGMNLDVMQSLVEELGLERLEARLEPQPGTCCVAFHRV